MIVVDASVAVTLILRGSAAKTIDQHVFNSGETLHAPHLIDIEVAHVVRRYCRLGDIEADVGSAALQDLVDLPMRRYPHDFLVSRVWALRDNFTAYDAVYVALAEVLEASLLTQDKKLASSARHFTRVELI